ncbi:GNAT family N-acetyltransferase [Marinactinospora thermotolerans]|uniref:Acetyltransferases n=1 Tax=Marinactinospora thermotolerans DSM 45154 TaxID=1122192 RepID=A0A1T4T8T1_9ACTN|nr:GNAT family N-acetyltransferase [Marinactinospora thermotolerans]SKA36691.1 Acetyltransferases [Marinactinospora thermotolerans DSM 45154]
MTQRLVEAVDETVAAFWAIGGEERTVNGAHWTRNLKAPAVEYCNTVGGLVGDDPHRLRDLLGQARAWTASPAMRVHVGATTPTATEAALLLAGCELVETLLELVVTGPLVGPTPAGAGVDILPVEDDAGWERLAELFRLDHEEEDAGEGRPPRPAEETAQAVLARRAKTPAVRYWLAVEEGRPCGFFSSWPRRGEMAKVEDLFVRPEHRGRGVATRLLHHAVADARSQGAGPVLIRAAHDDRPKHLYARMGFRPVAVTRYYAFDGGD